MKRTTIAYLSKDVEFELCPSCRHRSVHVQDEPCKSCVISNFEPMENPAKCTGL